MNTTIYLDVDGVINAIGHRHPTWKQTGFNAYESVMANGFQIAYAPELIAALNALSARDDVTIKWLTTWEHDAAKVLSPLIGLEGAGWEVLTGDQHRRGGGDWWKLVAIREDFEATDPWCGIWIDDDLSIERVAMNWAHRAGVRVISPDARYGLTSAHMANINVLIEAAKATA